MRSRITVLGEVNTLTGYGQHVLEAVQYLGEFGCFVSIRPFKVAPGPIPALAIPQSVQQRLVWSEQPEEWELLIGPPSHAPTPGKKTVYWTMWETTVLPKLSVNLLNQCETVIVPSNWCYENFKASGVTRPMVIIPLGYRNNDFYHEKMDMKRHCVFGIAGRSVHGRVRKGMDVAIYAFREAFTNTADVELQVKCFADDPLTLDAADGRIRLRREYWDQGAMREWFGRTTAFVTAARSEGWGLLQLQAMAVGRPVIGAIYGGLKDFMDSVTSYPVDFTEVAAEENYAHCGKWAYPSVDSLISQMRRVYLDREEARFKGLVSRSNVQALTWRQSISRCYDLLQTLGAL